MCNVNAVLTVKTDTGPDIKFRRHERLLTSQQCAKRSWSGLRQRLSNLTRLSSSKREEMAACHVVLFNRMESFEEGMASFSRTDGLQGACDKMLFAGALADCAPLAMRNYASIGSKHRSKGHREEGEALPRRYDALHG